jgi:uncharacterized protein YceK
MARRNPLNWKQGCSNIGLGCGRANAACATDELKMKKFFGLLMLSALLAGCTSITNLTPSRVPREPTGYCRVEAIWYSERVAIRPGSFKPLVVVDGFNTYPMQPVPKVQDRWEAYIPVPADKDMILYHFKFDFMEDAIGGPRPNSLMSRDYELKVK